MIQFIHTADSHFGIENYGKIDQKTGVHSRLLDFEKAFNVCIDMAIEKNVDFFLFCGDAYKTVNPTPTQQKFFLRSLLRLYKAQIPVIIIIGNHDNPFSFGKAHSLEIFCDLPIEGFSVISKPEIVRLKTKSGEVQIVGIPWPTRHSIALSDLHHHKSTSEIMQYISEKVGSIIQHFANQLNPNLPAVLAGHLTLSTSVFSGSEKKALCGSDPIFLPSQLAIKPFDYVALGHLHRHQVLHEKPFIVYPGSIERIDFGERNDKKGFCLVSISDNKETSYEFITLPIRSFIQIEVHLPNDKNQTEYLVTEIQKHDINDAIIKILYHLPESKKDSVDLSAILKTCHTAFHVASITPVYAKEIRSRRILEPTKMDLSSLLHLYFASKPLLKEKSPVLVEKAVELYRLSQEENKETTNEK